MSIQCPLDLNLIYEKGSELQRQLQVRFKTVFRDLLLPHRVAAMTDYIGQLESHIRARSIEDVDRQGMETVLQFCIHIKPYIEQDSIPLDDVIEVDIRSEIGIQNFLNS